MEVEKATTSMDSRRKEDDDDGGVPLPGFRFHPTDEELVGFYLRRKVEKKHFTIELIKHVDIYKYDPWDLPMGSNVGDKEWYYFCKRGRKYRNSVRPNRVTCSGFWKATGIDRPIYSTGGQQCIGLKKSLVYYRGSAGKGTKTDWMMHEFRLPALHDDKSTKHVDVRNIDIIQDAEVWTLCRILKRNASSKKCMPDWRQHSAKRNTTPHVDSSSKTCSSDSNNSHEGYNIDFRNPTILKNEKKNFANHATYETNKTHVSQMSSISQAQSTTSYSSFMSPDVNAIIRNGGWDDLRSAVEFAVDPFFHVNNW